ncbi:collagen-like protein [Polymorphobacter arshaanensis]|uniref:collagen-like protein n=1 Tax=Glacieibacterium arshaanense TaxID=2511025 RepID=UPI001409372B|nr:collagen-like protein [Polymorphobacter arshaanensis]
MTASFYAKSAIDPRGALGPKGDKGDTGDQGPIGPTGADGIPGPAGPAGADGADGAVGPVGPVGPAGADGTSGGGLLDYSKVATFMPTNGQYTSSYYMEIGYHLEPSLPSWLTWPAVGPFTGSTPDPRCLQITDEGFYEITASYYPNFGFATPLDHNGVDLINVAGGAGEHYTIATHSPAAGMCRGSTTVWMPAGYVFAFGISSPTDKVVCGYTAGLETTETNFQVRAKSVFGNASYFQIRKVG